MPRYSGDRGTPPPWQEQSRELASQPVSPVSQTTERETQKVVAQALRSAPAGVVPFRFSIGNLQPTANAQMFRVIAVDATTAQGATIGVPLVSRGSIVALTVASDESRVSGKATVQASINGAGSASLVWDEGATETAVFDSGAFGFATGDVLTVTVTTQDFSPTGSNVEVVVYVVQTQ